jgi:PleD family two-component response regulator
MANVQKIRTSELRYRRLFEAAQDGILILDAALYRAKHEGRSRVVVAF